MYVMISNTHHILLDISITNDHVLRYDLFIFIFDEFWNSIYPLLTVLSIELNINIEKSNKDELFCLKLMINLVLNVFYAYQIFDEI